MEPKAKTLQERFGFSDPDLKTPKHDALMLWLDAEMDSVLVKLFGQPIWKPVPNIKFVDVEDRPIRVYDEDDNYKRCKADCQQYIQRIKQQIRDELNLPEFPARIVKKKWETPVLDRTYTIGFADMYAIGDAPLVNCNFKATSLRTSNLDFNIEYLNSSVVLPQFTSGSPQAYFEVKPAIPSLGELIRQIRMYQTYTRNVPFTSDTPWVVVSPDKRFASQLEAQGIQFLEAPSDV